MTHAVLLSAGQGKRLSPLTDQKPKCLISIAGKTLLEWQLHALEACGINDVTIVTGFESRAVETAIKVMPVSLSVECILNPFYAVADNVGSCWAARDRIGSDTVLINGDTLFDPQILTKVLAEATDPITVTIDQKLSYDSDDMKVQTDGKRLERIGKDLKGEIDGESIGMLRFLDDGGEKFNNALEQVLRDPASLRLWYLSIIDNLASEGDVNVLSIQGKPWAEVDFPQDIVTATKTVSKFNWERENVGAMNDSKITHKEERP